MYDFWGKWKTVSDWLKYLGNPGELPILTNQRFSYSPSGYGIRQRMHFVSHALRRDPAMNAAFVHRLAAGCERKELILTGFPPFKLFFFFFFFNFSVSKCFVHWFLSVSMPPLLVSPFQCFFHWFLPVSILSHWFLLVSMFLFISFSPVGFPLQLLQIRQSRSQTMRSLRFPLAQKLGQRL